MLCFVSSWGVVTGTELELEGTTLLCDRVGDVADIDVVGMALSSAMRVQVVL